jgi:predicted nucleic acid-binding Zn ribbon protein
MCQEHHGEFESVHSIKEELAECPKCKEEGKQSSPPVKLISRTSFILVGGGWSNTGYS